MLTLAAAPLCLPRYAAAAFTDPEAGLRRALSGIALPVRPARLELVRFSLTPGPDRVRIESVVRMTWPPGTRQHGFSAEAEDAGRGLPVLLDRIRARFASVV